MIAFHLTPEDKKKYDTWFDQLRPQAGRLSEEKVRNFLRMLFELPDSTLDKIWQHCPLDKDGFLDRYQFTVAFHLTERAYNGWQIPDQVDIYIFFYCLDSIIIPYISASPSTV